MKSNEPSITRRFLKARLLRDYHTFRGFTSERTHVKDLLLRTVETGESNSALIVGPRGSGKTTVSGPGCSRRSLSNRLSLPVDRLRHIRTPVRTSVHQELCPGAFKWPCPRGWQTGTQVHRQPNETGECSGRKGLWIVLWEPCLPPGMSEIRRQTQVQELHLHPGGIRSLLWPSQSDPPLQSLWCGTICPSSHLCHGIDVSPGRDRVIREAS